MFPQAWGHHITNNYIGGGRGGSGGLSYGNGDSLPCIIMCKPMMASRLGIASTKMRLAEMYRTSPTLGHIYIRIFIITAIEVLIYCTTR
ncbi:hypothetical protein MSAN_00508100 [Mycena sanguinolenta]|uniref:Uncharacterized protein n=1 Tax=Mycena sanguinolenta TaxID=230812 RepID=A0A8H6Z8R7_9AGAR|nr:hypothetical protein MSAN_00508100 [Mycena sanguinolenta]